MRGPCWNCDRANGEYRDDLGGYYCDECYAFAIWEQEQTVPIPSERIRPVAGGEEILPGLDLADLIAIACPWVRQPTTSLIGTDDEAVFETDARQREARKRFLDELEALGQPRYSADGPRHEFGKPGPMRVALFLLFRAKASWLRRASRDRALSVAQIRAHVQQIPEPEARYLRRWRATRDRWVQAGCPDPKPWDLLGGRV